MKLSSGIDSFYFFKGLVVLTQIEGELAANVNGIRWLQQGGAIGEH